MGRVKDLELRAPSLALRVCGNWLEVPDCQDSRVCDAGVSSFEDRYMPS